MSPWRIGEGCQEGRWGYCVDWVKNNVIALVASAAAIIGAFAAIISASHARGSKRAAERSASAFERSALAAEAGHRLAIRPYVTAEIETRKERVPTGIRSHPELFLINRRGGLAQDIRAELSLNRERQQSVFCQALAPGEKHLVSEMGKGGRDVYGTICFIDAEGGAYQVAKIEDKDIWHLVG